MNTKKLNTLKAYFGYASLRTGQDEITDAILSGRDVLGIMPTGAGKSLCYQLPALMLPGITLVISPLISLMEDQTASLSARHISAVCINSKLKRNELNTIYQSLPKGRYKLVYVSPERLQDNVFRGVLEKCAVSLICIDEAHCIDSWGEDFRPSYRKIAECTSALSDADGKRPVNTAFTATASPRTIDLIIKSLSLKDPFTFNAGCKREDLKLSVIKCPGSKYGALISFLNKHRGECGIIYCSTRRSAEDLYAALPDMLKTRMPGSSLHAAGIPGTDSPPWDLFKYHGGMGNDERERNQRLFTESKCALMTATCAFGMGIDKSDIRFIVHYEMPGSIEDYFQEAGRAGRDGKGGECVLLYSLDDIAVRLALIKKDAPLSHPDYEKLWKMISYCSCRGDLQDYIVSCFGGSNTQHLGPGVFEKPLFEIIKKAVSGHGKGHFPVRKRDDLFGYLVILRKRLAAIFKINEGKIFSNKSLKAMSAVLPTSLPQLLLTEGVKPLSAMKYGKYFIYAISVYRDFISV